MRDRERKEACEREACETHASDREREKHARDSERESPTAVL